MIVGLTGGIGSGKSTIAKQLCKMGYVIYDTDSHAKRLIIEDKSVRQQIEQLFGKEVYKDGRYQTAIVAQRVFADKTLLSQLNAIVHPAVKNDILRWAEQNPSATCIVECAILYQAGFDKLCDKVIAVTAPEELRIQRAIARDQADIEKVRARMRAQDIEKSLQYADLVINNDGNTKIENICLQIEYFLHSIEAPNH